MLEGLYFKDKSSVSFEVLKKKDVNEAAGVFARVFVTREVLASCLNITILDMIPIAKALCHLCSLVKLSWIARVNGEIVGVCLCDMLERKGESTNERQKEATKNLETMMMKHPRALPIFEFLDVIDEQMLADMEKIDEKHRTLHIIAAAVKKDFGGYQIASMLAFKCVQHAQRVRKIQYVAQEATGSASQYLLNRSLGRTPSVKCVVKYADWISSSSSRPFQNTQCEQIVGRADKIEAIGTLEHTFKVASIYCAFYRSETLNDLSQSQALQLYAMYQQAIQGDARDDRAPSMSRIVKRAQFNAWRKVRGMSKRDAMKEFIKIIRVSQPYFADIMMHHKHRLVLRPSSKKHQRSGSGFFFIYNRGQQRDLVAKEIISELPMNVTAKPFKGRDVIESIMKTDMANTKYEARELASVLVETGRICDCEKDDDGKIPENCSSFSLDMTYILSQEEKNDDIKEQVSSKRHWIPDQFKSKCMACDCSFTLTRRRHHCRLCGSVVCHKCSSRTRKVFSSQPPVRVCTSCSSLSDDDVCLYVKIITQL